MILDFLNELITYSDDFQFLFIISACVIVIISVSLFYGLIVGLISSLFNRR